MLNKLKADLMIIIRELIVTNGWNQSEAAKQLSITQPRVSNLVHGQVSQLSVDNLYKILDSQGVRVECH